VFTVEGVTREPGRRRRRRARLEWADGELTGDPLLVMEGERRVEASETVRATPSGPAVEASLADARSAAILCASLFESFETDGDFPDVLTLDDAPPGAVA
jgi:hypothetical protein